MKSLILTVLALVSSSASAHYSHPVAVTWRVGEVLGNGQRLNHLTIVNNSEDSIKAPWSLYYGSLATLLHSDDPVFRVEQICGTHHRIVADSADATLAPGDSVALTLRGGYIHLRSFFPENPYLVASTVDGKDADPLRVALDYTDASHREMVSSIPGYPDGETVYARNEKLRPSRLPGIYDVIPSFKSVNARRGRPCELDGAVTVTADGSLACEKAVFAQMLRRQGVDVAEGALPINLRLTDGKYSGEDYSLKINRDGIEICGSTPEAVFNGCMSFLSIIAGRRMPLQLPPAEINDSPSLGYRGLHFDVARNFTGKADVMRVLDVMALYKLNKFHFHLVDDEGWRIAIDGLEELTEVGSRRSHTPTGNAIYPAYGSGPDGGGTGNGFYTRRDFIDILRYAADRHIEVIPEIDIPGHSRAAIMAMNVRYDRYKDTDMPRATEYLLCDFDDRSVYTSAQEYHDNVMNIAMPSALRFSKKVLDELIDMYGEAGVVLNTVHVGGDEVPDGAWEGSPVCRKYMSENGIPDTRALRDGFLLQLHEYLEPKGIRIAGWQEILTEADGKSPNRSLPGHRMLSYMWNTQPYGDMDQTTYALVNAGFPAVLCNVNNLYLDLAYGRNVMERGLTWGGYVDEFSTFATLPYDIYNSARSIDRPEDWEKDLAAGKTALRGDARKTIVGIQGQMWAESFRDFDMVMERLLPKVFGVAERAWNAEPSWAGKGYEDFREAAARYAARTGLYDLNRLARMGYGYHVPAPGIHVDNGMLHTNSAYPDAEVHYTVDGSDPDESSPLWTSPVAVSDAGVIKAVAVVNGRQSHVTELFM